MRGFVRILEEVTVSGLRLRGWSGCAQGMRILKELVRGIVLTLEDIVISK